LSDGCKAILERSDAQLVKDACNGDIDGFRCLYERHYALAVGIARSRLSDRHLAEDAAQEAFAIACRTLHTLRDSDRFAQWLGTICRRTATKMARLRVHGNAITEVCDTKDDCAQADIGRVRDAIQRLNHAAREILILHYYSGLAYAQIADVMAISQQAVHGRLQRARRMLAKQLTDNDDREL
jgi:RNA polymerase sigma-70 factor (ECF subfamily)